MRSADQLHSPPGTAMIEILGQDPNILQALETIRLISDTNANVLITGETGVGKELFARAIHQTSQYAKGPFVPVNLGAIPEALMEAELFGHVRGAFTDAVSTREGYILAAQWGTLFLDEIGDMPKRSQASLLRVLEDKVVTKVGSEKAINLDVRFVAATNKDLYQATENGEFRPDLFYRLDVIAIEIPPLRHRVTDIPILANAFLKKVSPSKRFDERAIRSLIDYPWPGNVRELSATVERSALMSTSDILSDRDVKFRNPGKAVKKKVYANLNMNNIIDRTRREVLDLALAQAKGCKSTAARLTGMNRTTFVEMEKRLQWLQLS